MKSSGIRRGLAVAAVGAMAAVVIPTAAHANTIAQQQDNANGPMSVTLYSPHPIANQASVKNDGQNTTVALEAAGSSDIDTMRWQFSTDGGVTWTNIGGVLTSPNDDGAWALEWNPAADSGLAYPTANVKVRAVGHSTLDGLIHFSATSTMTVSNTFDTIAIKDGSALGVWHSNAGTDNVILQGTASTNFPNARVAIADPNSGFDLGEQILTIVANQWKTVYDIKPIYSAAPFGYNAPDQIVFNAVTDNFNPLSADSEGYTLYNQVITTVDVNSTPENPANPATLVPTVVTVKDQNGNPIAGVNVSSGPDGGPYANLGTTDVNGQVATTQSVNQGSIRYIANAATGSQVNEDAVLGDKSKVKVLGTAFSSDLVGSSADGNAFDFDEQDGNDIQVQVKDQTNGNFDPTTQSLTYHWRQTAFSNGEVINGTSHNLGPAADVNGLFDIPTLNSSAGDFAHGLVSGTYELFVSLNEGGTGHAVAEKKVLTVKAGEASVEYQDPDGDGRTTVTAGSTASVPAKLVLEDGTALPGRKVDVNFVLGNEYDEHGNPGTPDAVIVSNDPDTTDATGSFTVKVEDLSHDPNQAEINGRIQAFSAASSFGDWLGDANQANPPVAEPYEHFVDFVANSVPAGSKINVEYGAIPANITDIGNADSSGPAGTTQNGGILLENAFGDPLAGVSVTLHLDHGFFVPFGTPNKAAAEGNYITTPNSLGDTITVTTTAAGRANFSTSIGRDAGFDDDGKVTATVTASIGAAADSDTNVWSSANPLNVSEVSVVRTPDASQANPVDPAPVNSPVLFDVFAKDQFGNPAAGVHVSITCGPSSDASCPGQFLPPSGLFATSDLDNGGDLTLIANKAGTYDFVATVDNIVTRKYGPAPSFTPQVQTVEDTFSQTWYASAIDPSKGATYTMTSSPGNPVQPGHPVTVTVTAKDQQGNPLAGVRVDFNRTEDSDTEISLFTDSNGEAAYVFEPDSECVDDTVTAVVRDTVTSDGDPADNGVVNTQSVVVSTLRDNGSTCGTGEPIQVSLTGHSGTRHGHSVDVMKVSASTTDSTLPATGAEVTLKAKIDGQWVTVGKTDRVLNSAGKVKFFPIDRTPHNGTKYQAFVSATATTAAGHSQVFTQR